MKRSGAATAAAKKKSGAAPVARLLSKWDDIHRDWVANVTRIYGRTNFHRIFDVVAHSAIGFKFQGNPVTRGWVEAMIAGDTKCGKSEVAEKLSSFFGIQAPLNAESATLAGIVGGVKEVGGKWSIQWGWLPRLDRRMATIDETTGLPVEHIGQMSGMRSSGVATVTKIESEKAKARVRKLWLSNPRSDRNRRVVTYPYGVMVFPEIMGRSEDISRFDVATVASSESVPLELLNAKVRESVKHVYTSEAAKALLHWVWSRKPENIVWRPGAESAVVDVATKQSRVYSSAIPLVEPGEQRFRVARIAVALACRFHSTDAQGDRVLVGPEHVALGERFMADCFDDPITGYRAYSVSRQGAGQEGLKDEEVKAILTALEKYPNLGVVLDAVTMSDDLTKIPVLDWGKQAQFMADLASLGLLEAGEGRMHKTKRFISFYRAARANIGNGPAKERF